MSPIGHLSPYLERYAADRGNCKDEWEVYWDYKRGVETQGRQVFDQPLMQESCCRFISYLFMFGMGRGSTRLIKTQCSRRFAPVIEIFASPHARDLAQQDFGEVAWTGAPFVPVWDGLGSALRAIHISDSAIMRSKILLAGWGEMPALDTKFRHTFKATWGFWTEAHPSRILNQVRQRYEEEWRAEIDAAPAAWKHTVGGNRIPDARLIDIAFWYHAAEPVGH